MRIWLLFVCLVSFAAAQAPVSPGYDLAGLREDVRLLNQRVGELTLRVEQLEHDNGVLQKKADAGSQAYATVAQLNEAVADLNRSLRAAIATSKTETLQHVAVQMEKLANQTNAALDSLSRGSAPRANSGGGSAAPAQSGFSSDYPKEGVAYTVQKGDTLARIAQKTGAKLDDIVNANKISDPTKIFAGQVLFIPGAK